MTTFEDFTSLPRGCEVRLAGRIDTCPLCGRNGIVSQECDRGCFIHTQETDLSGDGMRIDPIDQCFTPLRFPLLSPAAQTVTEVRRD